MRPKTSLQSLFCLNTKALYRAKLRGTNYWKSILKMEMAVTFILLNSMERNGGNQYIEFRIVHGILIETQYFYSTANDFFTLASNKAN